MMLRRTVGLWVLATLGACASQGGSAQSTEADVAALRRLITQDWPAAAQAADTARYVDFLTNDFVYMAPGVPAFRSKAELARWLQGAFDAATFEIAIDPPEEIVVTGDWAYARYHVSVVAHPKAGGPATRMDRKYMDIWRREPDGAWKCHRHMWNDNPAPVQPS